MCKDNPRRKCKSCACSVCGGKNDPDKQILCDECDQAYHLWCLSTPLQTVPEEDEWWDLTRPWFWAQCSCSYALTPPPPPPPSLSLSPVGIVLTVRQTSLKWLVQGRRWKWVRRRQTWFPTRERVAETGERWTTLCGSGGLIDCWIYIITITFFTLDQRY